MNERRSAGPPLCSKGHVIEPVYTIQEVRTLEILIFECGVCDERWNPGREERDAFLQYLESRPEDAVPS